MHPAGGVHVGESGGDSAQDPVGAVDRPAGHGVVQYVLQAGLGTVHHQRDGAVQRGQLRCLHGAHGVGPDEVRVVGLRAEPDLARHEFPERGTLPGAQSTGREHLHRHGRAVLAPAGLVHRPPAAGADDRAHLPAVDAEPLREAGRSGCLQVVASAGSGHAPAPCGARRPAPRGGSRLRCSSRTRPKRRATEASRVRLAPVRPPSVPVAVSSPRSRRSFAKAR